MNPGLNRPRMKSLAQLRDPVAWLRQGLHLASWVSSDADQTMTLCPHDTVGAPVPTIMQGSSLRPCSQVLLPLYAASTQVPTGLQQTMAFPCSWLWSPCLLGAYPSSLQTAPRAEVALPICLMPSEPGPIHSLYMLELLVLHITDL